MYRSIREIAGTPYSTFSGSTVKLMVEEGRIRKLKHPVLDKRYLFNIELLVDDKSPLKTDQRRMGGVSLSMADTERRLMTSASLGLFNGKQ